MPAKIPGDERINRALRTDSKLLERQKSKESFPFGGVHHIPAGTVAAQAILTKQAAFLQRTAGNSAVGRLVATSRPAVLQRLAYNENLKTRELSKVFKVPGKSTFIVTGRDRSKLVVKFEPGGEAQDQKKARLTATNLLAKQILPNVPNFQFLSGDELTALSQVPVAWGADAKFLSQIAVDAMPGGQFLGLKLEFLPVGDNLEDMIKKAVPGATATPAPAGPAAAPGGPAPTRPQLPPQVQTEAMLLLQSNPTIWVDFGRMAAFDLFVGNADRFHTVTPTVNVQNLDFTSGANPAAVALDNFNPSASIFAMKNDERSFGKGFPEPLKKSSAVKAYSQAVVSNITAKVGIDALNTYDDAFVTGFNMSRNAIKSQKTNLKDAVQRSTQAQEQAKVDYYSFLLARVKLMK